MTRCIGRAPKDSDVSVRFRHSASTDRLLTLFILASLPTALVGAWHIGALEIARMGTSADNPIAAVLLGLSFIAPLLFVSTLTCIMWEIIFAATRKRAIDPGWLMASWLYVMLLPHQTPLILAAIGMSFGAVFGKHVFGGTGRYIASPALVGALFLYYAYPPLGDLATTWQTVADLGAMRAAEQGISWWHIFFGDEVGLLGTGSALACLLGAIGLACARVASLRTLLGAIVGLFVAASIAGQFGNTLPAHWHFALGSFSFCWAFVLTDPTTLPLTKIGRWLHGATFGVLVILIREADPTHPEATLFALLLASLFVPLIDYIVLRAHIARFGGQLELET
jgi:Na+-transporting NADH:ubiquinone oxidoreductase subunit B